MLGAVSHLSKIQLHVVLDKHLIETATVTFLLLGWNVVPQSTVREFVLAHSCRGRARVFNGGEGMACPQEQETECGYKP